MSARDADGIIFDCDGVLVDVAGSYGEATIRTVSFVMRRLGMPDAPPITHDAIQSFKDTGGFNNEIDLAYAAVLCLAGALRAGLDARTALGEGSALPDAKAVEGYAEGLGVRDVIETLSYPERGNVVSETFDQLFYGPALYRERFGVPSGFGGPGLIERDRLLIDRDVVRWLRRRFGARVGMLTGRSRTAALHTMGSYMDAFNDAGCVFLEDMPRSMAKPNPAALLSAVRAMDAKHCIYVGDSAEDMIMAQAAPDAATFVGVYGTAPSPDRRRDFFGARGVRHVVRSVSELPALTAPA